MPEIWATLGWLIAVIPSKFKMATWLVWVSYNNWGLDGAPWEFITRAWILASVTISWNLCPHKPTYLLSPRGGELGYTGRHAFMSAGRCGTGVQRAVQTFWCGIKRGLLWPWITKKGRVQSSLTSSLKDGCLIHFRALRIWGAPLPKNLLPTPLMPTSGS